MKLTSKGRYGLRAIVDLTIHGEKEPVSIKSISIRQGISERYLEQIIGKMKKAGIVESVRGAAGGYRLAKDPSKFPLGMFCAVWKVTYQLLIVLRLMKQSVKHHNFV